MLFLALIIETLDKNVYLIKTNSLNIGVDTSGLSLGGDLGEKVSLIWLSSP